MSSLGGEYRDEQISIIDGNVSLRNNEQTEQLAGFFLEHFSAM